jgi:hypothetical protein
MCAAITRVQLYELSVAAVLDERPHESKSSLETLAVMP